MNGPQVRIPNPTVGIYSQTLNIPKNTTTTIGSNKINITIGKSCNVTILGSEYGIISIDQGSTVIFSQPTLNIGKLVMLDAKNKGSSSLNFQTDAVVRVKQSVSIGKYCNVNQPGADVIFY
jgi:hypothetical protein